MTVEDRTRIVVGVVPVIPIPFDASEEIDEAALRDLIDFAAACGVDGICLPAYGSEFYKLSEWERTHVVEIAVRQSAGRMQVIAQSNHGSARIATALAKTNVATGADIIAVSIPRQFVLPDADLLRYLALVLDSVAVPCLVQDFSPTGPTVTVDFIARLHQLCPNFRYLKLEEPLMGPKLTAIHERTNGQLTVLEGSGGLYMMELIPLGLGGVMPGLALTDLLSHIFQLRRNNESARAFDLFERVLPQIAFSMQNMELYLFCEKQLLKARGILTNACCRHARFSPDPFTVRHVEELNSRVLEAIKEARLPSAIG